VYKNRLIEANKRATTLWTEGLKIGTPWQDMFAGLILQDTVCFIYL
jgi:hypothetical protein